MTTFQENFKGNVSTVNTIYKWELANYYIGCKEFGSQYWSPVFRCNNSKWQIQLLPRGDREESKDYVSIYLWLRDGECVEATYEFSIVNNKNEVTVLYKDKQKFATKKRQGSNRFTKQDALTDRRNGLLIGETLRILCKISVDETRHIVKRTTDCTPNKRLRLSTESQVNQEIGNFEKFFKREQLSDVKFVTSCGRSIHVHKTILANKSEVFMAMFAKSLGKKIEVIEVHDVDYEILEEMFRYMYSNVVVDLGKHTGELLVVAVKYEINSLKHACELNLCKSLSIENVADGLITARSYNLARLERQAIDFIAAHMKDLVNEPTFKSVTSLHPDILTEILRRTAETNV